MFSVSAAQLQNIYHNQNCIILNNHCNAKNLNDNNDDVVDGDHSSSSQYHDLVRVELIESMS